MEINREPFVLQCTAPLAVGVLKSFKRDIDSERRFDSVVKKESSLDPAGRSARQSSP